MRIQFSIKQRLNQPMLLVARLAFVFVILSFTRWLFYIFNLNSFHHIRFGELMQIMFVGIRYDASVIAYFNLLFIFLSLLPSSFRYHPLYEKSLRIVYVITNSILIILNLIDVILYRYISKRTTTELTEFFFNPAENSSGLLVRFFIDFWYILLIAILLIYTLVYFGRFFKSQSPTPIRRLGWYVRQTSWLLVFIFFTIIAARGGFQLKPIGLISAAQYTESRNIPLLINTPFSIIKTFGSRSLTEKTYFTEQELVDVFTPIHMISESWNKSDSLSCQGFNVIILIIESLGRDYIGFYTPRQQTLTPFLDSLFSHSIVFDGFANGKRSIEALPSILAGIPSLMPSDFPSSPYINNHIQGIGTILKGEGYNTAFFHGGNNGTMGFDIFSAMSGFEQYFGRDEFPSNKYFDGHWGIYDEPFLLYTIQEINKIKPPFAAGIFTLSSHHPYSLPPEFQGMFKQAHNNMEATFCYVDHALQIFFQEAAQQPWFEKTIFVITADHTPENTYQAISGDFESVYAVPIVFYIPEKAIPNYRDKAQHIDILPSLMALLDSRQPVFSFGRNLFDPLHPPYVLNYMNEMFKFVRNDTLVITNGDTILEMYDLRSDPTMEHNLIPLNSSVSDPLLQFSRGIIQQYNNRMIRNQLFPLVDEPDQQHIKP